MLQVGGVHRASKTKVSCCKELSAPQRHPLCNIDSLEVLDELSTSVIRHTLMCNKTLCAVTPEQQGEQGGQLLGLQQPDSTV